MKQIKIPAMLLALALTLTACAAGQKTFQRGSVEGRTYTSEFLGLTCTAPEEFAYLSDQEIAEMNSITLESRHHRGQGDGRQDRRGHGRFY